ncbi:hypothetical protein AGRO_2864 [Agrobacterium sp. ATCC 31749]|nr:hypothetical protein AGRO_2864 [Agrobacterium sp. ATCC 31749]
MSVIFSSRLLQVANPDVSFSEFVVSSRHLPWTIPIET